MNKTGFFSADILLPAAGNYETWAVVACDQFTSEPEYWERVEKLVGDQPSAFRLILPEARETIPRTAFAKTGLGRELTFDPPVPGEEERVFFQKMKNTLIPIKKIIIFFTFNNFFSNFTHQFIFKFFIIFNM